MKLWTEEDAERIRIKEEQKMMEQLAQKKFDALGETLCVVDKRNRIFRCNKDSFFPISAESFSDGFGGEWFYEDRNETWSDNPLEFYEKFCEKNNYKIDAFNNLVNNITDWSLSDSQKIKLQTAFVKGFYGTMYGEEYTNKPHIEVIHIKPFDAQLYYNHLYYVWGWPGPDANTYHIDDYGKTWALTKEELVNGVNYFEKKI